jgi:hypothetical protein
VSQGGWEVALVPSWTTRFGALSPTCHADYAGEDGYAIFGREPRGKIISITRPLPRTISRNYFRYVRLAAVSDGHHEPALFSSCSDRLGSVRGNTTSSPGENFMPEADRWGFPTVATPPGFIVTC